MHRDADAAAAYFGVLATGGVAVVMAEGLRPRQVEHIVGHSGASVLLCSADTLKRMPRQVKTPARRLDPAEVPDRGELAPLPRVAGDVAQIVYTSGSTGLPKGVTFSHGNLRAGARAVVRYLGIEPDDRLASVLPFSFDYGLNQLLCAVATGAALIVERAPVAARVVRTVVEARVSVLACVPPLWLQLLSTDAFQAPLESLRLMTNTGGRLPVPAVQRLREVQPQAKLVLMYGLTEAFRSTYLPPERVDKKPGSIGRAIPEAEVVVIGPDGRECAPGETGELVHRGPTVALGYWNEPEATAQRYRPNPVRPPGTPDSERVVYSGDLVRRDDEGDLFFVGRRDAMIKTMGYRISPDEIAEVLHASGQVAEAVVTSEPDAVRGAAIVARVVLAPGGAVDDLTAFARAELPSYMLPSRVEEVDELPRTATGKYDSARVR
jgi:acyl-CoA synthetase (AMP-forming)/AMP-acid ligase II